MNLIYKNCDKIACDWCVLSISSNFIKSYDYSRIFKEIKIISISSKNMLTNPKISFIYHIIKK